MSETITRRDSLRGALAALGAVALMPEWAPSALAEGDTDVPFTDLPKVFAPGLNTAGTTRTLDIRKIDGQLTPADQFFFIQHKNQPKIDAATYRLKFTGLVKRPAELSLADLKTMHTEDLINGYECSGNSPRGIQ
jgi:DMSO/TMAO reductase YedYZ molybdopterin-dependent catalytic subunit